MKVRRFTVALALVALVAAVTTATSVARSTSSNRLAGLPNTCHTFGKGKYVIASDLPLQGSLRPLAVQIVAAIRLELKQMNFKIGDKTITYASCDDSTAAKGSWDSQTCTNNANGYKTVKNFLGLIGTFNSGCAEIIAPILNRAPGGGIAMVSPANTYVGLTKPTGVPGEPGKYFPSGKRNYARVAVPDNFQGAADATFLQQKGIKSVYVLNDGEAYGSGIANNFVNAAKALGITVLGNDKWDANQPDYQSLFQAIAPKNPQAIFLGGLISLHGGQLIKDKVKVLGDNTKVIMMGPDGFSGYTDLQKQKEGEGMYLSFAGLDTESLRKNGGGAAKFLDAYKAKYGADPSTSYALYAVAAVQVILKAIEGSDGSRKSITDQVFGGAGITIPADVSVIGKEIIIDPKTGDTNNKDISILQLTSGVEKFVKAQPVE
jgi:branched-chain amino acid transport system substrate-binding protein